MFLVTKLFIGGILEGLTHTSVVSFEMEVGFECLKPIDGAPYRIIACEAV